MNALKYVVYKHSFKIYWRINLGVFMKHLLTHSLTMKFAIYELSNEV